jgi:hypothetical protein
MVQGFQGISSCPPESKAEGGTLGPQIAGGENYALEYKHTTPLH